MFVVWVNKEILQIGWINTMLCTWQIELREWACLSIGWFSFCNIRWFLQKVIAKNGWLHFSVQPGNREVVSYNPNYQHYIFWRHNSTIFTVEKEGNEVEIRVLSMFNVMWRTRKIHQNVTCKYCTLEQCLIKNKGMNEVGEAKWIGFAIYCTTWMQCYMLLILFHTAMQTSS